MRLLPIKLNHLHRKIKTALNDVMSLFKKMNMQIRNVGKNDTFKHKTKQQ